MNADFPAIVLDLWSLAGWTMVHFLWLGMIVAAFAFAGHTVLRNAKPNVRYTFALGCLALIATMPLVAASLYMRPSHTRAQLAAEPSPSGSEPNTSPSGRGQGEGALPTRISPERPSSTDSKLQSTTPPIIELHTPSTDVAKTADTNSPPLKGGAGGGIPSDANAQTTAAPPTAPISELHTPTPLTATPPNPPALDPRPSTLDRLALAPRDSLLSALICYLPWLWLIGTPLTFALLFTGLIGTRRLSRASTPINEGPADALARLTASLRITRHVTVAVCERVAAPVLIGILRPMILLPPAALTGWSPDEIEMVLLHELAHIRRYDNVVNLAQRIIESLLFFHPAVWLISTWVRREREACCDAAVVARTQQPHAYATLLLNIASKLSELSDPSEPGRPHSNSELNDSSEPGRPRPRPFPLRRGRGRPGSLPVSSPMAAGPLRTRIRHILQLEDDSMLITPKSLAITLATLLAAATLAFVYLPINGQAEQKTTEATENTEKIDSQKKSAAQDATQKNLKKLIVAVQNNVGNRDNLPANALYDPERRPLLSWRVYILPFLAEEKLYSEFHLGEPWDSEHNRKLIARMPAVFKNPKIDKPGFTNYLAVVGKECVFNGTPNGLRLRDITDGTSNTIAIVEANAELAVEWTKPQDWKFDRATPTKGLGQQWGDGWYAAWVDGSVRRTENSEPADKIGIQFTRAGGEIESLKESANGVSSLEGGMGSPPGMNEGMPVAGAAGAGPAAAKFPSLEDQKLADLAWKRLGLELEPIAADDLQRVKALGYDGGVKVSANDGHTVAWEGQSSIHPNDILVGLHVWPTANLKDIAIVLNRDDLAELNPLKFYVVRRIPERIGGSPADPGKDNVITGRINVELAGTVNLDRTNTQESDEAARAALKSARDRFLPFEQAVVNAQANLEQAKANSADVQGAQRVLDAAQQQFEEAQKSYRAVVRRFVKIVPSSDEPLPVHPAPPPTQLQPASLPSPPYSVTFDRYNAGPSTTTPTPPTENSPPLHSVLINPSIAQATPPLAPRASQLAPSTSAPPILAPQTLRYDGKPFEEWRNVWKTELSTEKRIEAVKALAAFGRAGYGPDAAAAILNVAGEYDYNRSGDLDKALRETIEDALIFKVPAKDWLPDLRARYDKAPEKWKSLALSVLKNALDADEADAKRNRDFLLQLSRASDWSFANRAINSLVNRYPDAPETTQRLLEVLKDKEHWLSAVEWFGKTKQFPPEVIDLVLHGDDKQQAKIRAKFFLAANSPAYVSALQALLEILKDDSKSADHLAAIRAIGAGRTSDSLPQPDRDAALEVIVEKGPLNSRIAAAVALQNATGGRIQSFPLLEKKLGDLSQHKVTRNELLNLHNMELSIQQNRQ